MVFLIAMHENSNFLTPTPEDLLRWQDALDFSADALLLEPERTLMDGYAEANPGPLYTQAVTVIFDKTMKIRRVGGTYERDHDLNLQFLETLLEE